MPSTSLCTSTSDNPPRLLKWLAIRTSGYSANKEAPLHPRLKHETKSSLELYCTLISPHSPQFTPTKAQTQDTSSTRVGTPFSFFAAFALHHHPVRLSLPDLEPASSSLSHTHTSREGHPNQHTNHCFPDTNHKLAGAPSFSEPLTHHPLSDPHFRLHPNASKNKIKRQR